MEYHKSELEKIQIIENLMRKELKHRHYLNKKQNYMNFNYPSMIMTKLIKIKQVMILLNMNQEKQHRLKKLIKYFCMMLF